MGVFSRTLTHMVGIDISETTVKLLELSQPNANQYRVESYAVVPLPQHAVTENEIKDIEAVSRIVKEVVSCSGTKAKLAAVAVTGSTVITKTIQMDADLTPLEIETQIELEADNHIPYPIDEVNLDFEVQGLSQKDENLVDVLLVASHRTNVESRVDAIEEAGLKVKVVDVESYALERSYHLIAETLPPECLDKIVAVVDVGSMTTTLTIMYQGKSIYTREDVFGGHHLTEEIQRRYGLTYEEAGKAKRLGGLPDDYIPEVLNPFKETIVQHINRAINFFLSSNDVSEISYIVLAGGCAAIPALEELIAERLGFTAEVANPFADMVLAPKVNARALSNDAPAMMICCGLAMRGFSYDEY